jgi:serine/threonine protein kinase
MRRQPEGMGRAKRFRAVSSGSHTELIVLGIDIISRRAQVYKLVQDLHRLGVVHEDLEPRNVVRTHGGGFRLIDFSQSRRHTCKESTVQYIINPSPIVISS